MDSKNDLFDFNNLDNPEIKSKINPNLYEFIFDWMKFLHK